MSTCLEFLVSHVKQRSSFVSFQAHGWLHQHPYPSEPCPPWPQLPSPARVCHTQYFLQFSSLGPEVGMLLPGTGPSNSPTAWLVGIEECLKVVQNKFPTLKNQGIPSSKTKNPISGFSWKKMRSEKMRSGSHHQVVMVNPSRGRGGVPSQLRHGPPTLTGFVHSHSKPASPSH